MEVGVNMFLGKPYQEEELLDGIASLLRHTEPTI
jgi:FixJ family two-component response regulator